MAHYMMQAFVFTTESTEDTEIKERKTLSSLRLFGEKR
jgi:hypothetical protein